MKPTEDPRPDKRSPEGQEYPDPSVGKPDPHPAPGGAGTGTKNDPAKAPDAGPKNVE